VLVRDERVTLRRVQNGYASLGTSGHGRPLRDLKNYAVSSENTSARARGWTRVPYSSFPRNEGVRGSNPRVGFKALEIGFFSGASPERWSCRQSS
jgi:hypothetical protein